MPDQGQQKTDPTFWQPFFDLSVYRKYAFVLGCFAAGFLLISLHDMLFLHKLEGALLAVRVQAGSDLFNPLLAAIVRHRQAAVLLLVVVLTALCLGSFFCVYFLVQLLREMDQGLHRWRRIQLTADPPSREAIPVLSRDELGQIAQTANHIIDDIQELARFRHIIEVDETVEMVYRRMATVLDQRLGIEAFILWQVQDNGQDITPMVMHPPELAVDTCRFSEAMACRALRTNEPISADSFDGICPLFPDNADTYHTCVPMYTGSAPLGVVQLLFPRKVPQQTKREHRLKTVQARQYIRECLPVLHAKRLASHLHELAVHDQLTGLYNRRYLESHIQRLTASILRRGTHLAVLMCDMDYFKRVNDEQGHEAGDQVLRKLADLLLAAVREVDLVIRYGGEEFLVLLVDCEAQPALVVAEKIRAMVAGNPFRIGDLTLRKTISIGVSAFPGDTAAFWECVKFADVALYKAKEKGRNQVVRFEPEMWTDKDY